MKKILAATVLICLIGNMIFHVVPPNQHFSSEFEEVLNYFVAGLVFGGVAAILVAIIISLLAVLLGIKLDWES